jgi:valyl-tRNA synthetase
MEDPKTPLLAKVYQSTDFESLVSAKWDESKLTNPDECIATGVVESNAATFSIVLPPPNVTGTLHIGHASMLAIEDAIVRYKRMSGLRTLWLPGTDHAAIATQSKVEKILWETEGKTRHDIGREELLSRVAKFAKESHDTIEGQVRAMGASVDWSREAFTLDEARGLAVRTAFKHMYDLGLIYRGKRIVNWDPKGETNISDDEVMHAEVTGKFYTLQYGPFEIGTARPETKFGDKYVVMHPDDTRYSNWEHGDTFEAEWINGPITATVIKDAMVDPEFGTGVMTITPWHSHEDFDLAQKYQLDMEPIIGFDGKLLPIAGEFAGMHIRDARGKIVEKLQAKGLVVSIDEKYKHQIATAERTGEVIEPQVREQWFIAVDQEFDHFGTTTTIKKLMHSAVSEGSIAILPERFDKTYFHWINNLRDWCISRQIWYGHRIPVWYRGGEVYCGIDAPQGDGWSQDPDTLDTWFSSGLWTFSTLGWPNTESKDFQDYHPTDLLETGYDILFFWVARMILFSRVLLNDVPFKTVYLHGLVRDEKGRKMSKSLGNIIDPLTIIATHGADALRIALTAGSTPGNDIKMSESRITDSRNLVNKLWNMGRYIQGLGTAEAGMKVEVTSPADHFILRELTATTAAVRRHLDAYNLSLAIESLRVFTWESLADWYLEASKVSPNLPLLRMVFAETLKLWHPFMPFVTETLYQSLYPTAAASRLLMGTSYPEVASYPKYQDVIANEFSAIQQLITGIRRVQASYQLSGIAIVAHTNLSDTRTITHFTRVTFVAEESVGLPVQFKNAQVVLHILAHINLPRELERLNNLLLETQKMVAHKEKLASNPGFAAKASDELRSALATEIAALTETIALTREEVATLQSLQNYAA